VLTVDSLSANEMDVNARPISNIQRRHKDIEDNGTELHTHRMGGQITKHDGGQNDLGHMCSATE
jgi:hypothetical protein